MSILKSHSKKAKSKANPARQGFFSKLFSNRKISTKIATGFSAILAIMVVISGVAYYEFGAVAHQFKYYANVVHTNAAIDEIDRQFLSFQRFVDSGSTDADRSAAVAAKARAIIQDQLATAKKDAADSTQLAEIEQFGDRLDGYFKDFDRLVPMRVAHLKLVKEVLEPSGRKLLTQLQQLQVSAASQTTSASTNAPSNAPAAADAGGANSANDGSFILFGEAIRISMQLRLYVARVTVRHDKALIDTAKQTFSNLNLILAQLGLTPANKKGLEQVQAASKAFNDTFFEAANQSAAIDKLLNQDMHNTARDIGAAAEQLRAKSAVNEQRTQRDVTTLIAWATTAILALAIGCLALGAAFSWFIGRVISKPVVALVPQLRKLADGDFNISLPGLGRKDEIGEISAAVEMVVEKVGTTINNIKLAATEVTSASAEISTSTTDLSQRTEEQAASLEETSASMEQISATVKKNAENAHQAQTFANETNMVAERGGSVVGAAVNAMARIEESSRKISDIIGVIDEIARQTNLLALNAAVEAARAGEAGRGFAVVASEVRTLAQRSSQAAKDIKGLIVNSGNQVKDGVELVNKAGQSLNEIVASIKKVTDIVADIANASMEQATGLEQINKALAQMDEVTQQNSALVEENAATAKTLEHQAKSMDERVATFRLRAAGGGMAVEAFTPQFVADTRPMSTKTPPTSVSAPSRSSGKPVAKPQPVAAAKRLAAGSEAGGPVGRMQAAIAAAVNDDVDWKEF